MSRFCTDIIHHSSSRVDLFGHDSLLYVSRDQVSSFPSKHHLSYHKDFERYPHTYQKKTKHKILLEAQYNKIPSIISINVNNIPICSSKTHTRDPPTSRDIVSHRKTSPQTYLSPQSLYILSHFVMYTHLPSTMHIQKAARREFESTRSWCRKRCLSSLTFFRSFTWRRRFHSLFP